MGDLIGAVVIIGIVYLMYKVPEWKHNNRLCPPGKEIDWQKSSSDLASGISKQEYYRRYNSGYYDKDKK